MRAILMVAALATAFPATAQPIDDPQRLRATLVQQAEQRRIDEARERCLANRGTDCDTYAGLREWLLLDRSRAEAVLDRLAPGDSASAGSSAPVRPDIPAVSPRQQ